MKTSKLSSVKETVQALQAGKVIAFPTDTVFGVGVVYDDKNALQRLKDAKRRDKNKPIPMMVASLKQVLEVAEVDTKYIALLEHFMPGAFTIVVKRKKTTPAYVSDGLDTIAIRMPDDEFLLEVMQKLGKPLLVSSANLSAHGSCSTSDEVLQQLDGRIDAIVEGNSKSDTASTIVDISGENIKILREGVICKDKIIRKYMDICK